MGTGEICYFVREGWCGTLESSRFISIVLMLFTNFTKSVTLRFGLGTLVMNGTYSTHSLCTRSCLGADDFCDNLWNELMEGDDFYFERKFLTMAMFLVLTLAYLLLVGCSLKLPDTINLIYMEFCDLAGP